MSRNYFPGIGQTDRGSWASKLGLSRNIDTLPDPGDGGHLGQVLTISVMSSWVQQRTHEDFPKWRTYFSRIGQAVALNLVLVRSERGSCDRSPVAVTYLVTWRNI